MYLEVSQFQYVSLPDTEFCSLVLITHTVRHFEVEGSERVRSFLPVPVHHVEVWHGAHHALLCKHFKEASLKYFLFSLAKHMQRNPLQTIKEE